MLTNCVNTLNSGRKLCTLLFSGTQIRLTLLSTGGEIRLCLLQHIKIRDVRWYLIKTSEHGMNKQTW